MSQPLMDLELQNKYFKKIYIYILPISSKNEDNLCAWQSRANLMLYNYQIKNMARGSQKGLGNYNASLFYIFWRNPLHDAVPLINAYACSIEDIIK